MVTVALADEAATAALGEWIAPRLLPGDAVLLEGGLGSGKTTLARALLRAALGDPCLEVPSPTYTLVQSYTACGATLHHYDLWRLDGPGGLTELGWQEALADIVVVEWPDRLGDARPDGALRIALTLAGAGRLATLSGWGERLAGL